MNKKLKVLTVITLACFVALGWNYIDYCGYRDRVLMSAEPIVEPFLWYSYTFNLLWVIGGLGCLWMWTFHNHRKAPVKILTLLFILTAFLTPMSIVKAEDCEIDVVVALDEEMRSVFYWRGLGLPPYTGRQLAAMTVADLQNFFYDRFSIVFNVVSWVDWDSNDAQYVSKTLALEAHNEISHEDAMLWAFTNQEMEDNGWAIPYLHVQITGWKLPRFLFNHINTHEIGHLFTATHCSNYCVMNPAETYNTIGFCDSHTTQINYWKNNWQLIPPPPPPPPGGGGGGNYFR